MIRKLFAVILAIVLIISLTGANALVAADRTVLDSEFVTDEFEKQGVYTELTESFQDDVSSEFGGEQIQPGEELPPGITAEPIDAQQVANDTITTEFVRNEVNRNIEQLYAFLHGERDTLNPRINTTPVKEGLLEEVEEMNVQVDAPEAVAGSGSLEDGELSITADDIAALEESEKSFDETRTELWVDVVFEQTSNEDLLLLIGENPNDYPDNEQAVQEHEEEIRSELRSELQSYDDLNDDAKEEIDRLNRQLKDESEQQLAQQDELNDDLRQGLQEMQFTVIDGLTGDVTYDEYTERLESAESDVATEIESMIQQRIEEEVPNEIASEEEITRESNEELAAMSTQVQRMSLLAWVLSILSIILVGLIGVATRSFGWTTATSGVAFSIVGLVGVVADIVLRQTAVQLMKEEIQTGTQDQVTADLSSAFIGVVESAIGTYGTQSLLLLVLGLVLIGLAIANRVGLLDPLWEQVGVGEEAGMGTTDGKRDTGAATHQRAGEGTAGDRSSTETETGTSDETGADRSSDGTERS